MAEKSEREPSPAKDRDERVAIPLDPNDALRGLLQVDPASSAKDESETHPAGNPKSNEC